ncbi:hypothetical protein SAMN04490248_10670 [Salinihabitans flavidus]|uniref:Rcc01698-like C-terminal domain-containing protein n=1 Tax=Salinihabitans flavidus TaxID=569882 RepID=A0A1H8Q9N2_9RHOB|nr:hypothetical protein SAMN04490248_10670 [Salinihabitans flavidus]
MHVGAGDVIELAVDDAGNPERYRIDRVEQGAMQLLEAVRIESEVYVLSDIGEDTPGVSPFVPPVPVLPVFLDLPLMTGDEVPHAPHIAVTAKPWPGTVALYNSDSDSNYRLDQIIGHRAVVGVSETPLFAASSSLLDKGPDLQIRLTAGQLEGVDEAALLSGRNLAAIGDGSAGNWELFQFQRAELLEPNTYLLRNRLRGQLGSDGIMPAQWPSGSTFVLIDPALTQIALKTAARNLARHYRIGPARRGYDDPSYEHRIEAFSGIGLRPYAPCHLRVTADGAGGSMWSWIRRTRIDGDEWDLPEVPLGEESEVYVVRVMQGSMILREAVTTTPNWIYTAAEKADDGVSVPYEVHVAQISARFGAGLFARATVSD